MLSLALLSLTIFALNVLPAFAPPTWMLLSFYGFQHPDGSAWLIALIAAASATGGRVVLAQFAQRIANSRWTGPEMRGNLNAVAEALVRRRTTSAIAFVVFAISPLPSNALFLAYGLTRAPLWLLALPFFIGRLLSYFVAFAGGSVAAQALDPELTGTASGLYFLASQIALLALVYGFTRVNWRKLLGRLG